MGEFSDMVFDAVLQVPRGKVATYGQIARMVGRPRSARYVGFALRANPRPGIDADSIPCHRIVFKDGSLCEGFAFGGPDVQYRRLEDEGVEFLVLSEGEDPRVDMKACQWDGRVSEGAGGAYPTTPPPDFDWAAELGD